MYLSVSRIENFVSVLSENLLDQINSGIWAQICRRLILAVKPNEKNPHNCCNTGETRKEAPLTGSSLLAYYGSNEPCNVIAYLARQYHGNVHDMGIVNVTAKSIPNDIYHPRNVVNQDRRGDSFYSSKSEPNSWICYDFKEWRVIPMSYSVTSQASLPGSCHLRSRVIEVSNDGTENSWMEIDRREDNNALNSESVTVSFEVSRVPSEGVRFFRLRQTGANHFGSHHLTLSCLDIFGIIRHG